MSLLNFDGPAPRQLKKPAKIALALAIAGVVVSLASTLAANISINSGPVEFGQGVAQTTACDDAITVTPHSTFINSSNLDSQTAQSVPVGATDENSFAIRPDDRDKFYVGLSISFSGEYVLIDTPTVVTSISGLIESTTAFLGNMELSYPIFSGYDMVYVIDVADDLFGEPTQATATFGGAGFQLSGVDLSEIDATEGKCRGKTLTIKAYGETETAALATYSVYVGGESFTSNDGSITDSNAGTSSSSFSLLFNSAKVAANDVYKITIESSQTSSPVLNNRTFSADQVGIGATTLMGPSVIPVECELGSCSSQYIRFDNALGSDVVSVVLSINGGGDPNKFWKVEITLADDSSFYLLGYIEHFNGAYGVFMITEDDLGPVISGDQAPIIFSMQGPLPVVVSGEPEGSLTWNSTGTDRYVE
jgi:hypothetical protein